MKGGSCGVGNTRTTPHLGIVRLYELGPLSMRAARRHQLM